MTLKINASSERGIETVRNKIKDFSSTIGISTDITHTFKLLILDEADEMTYDAQTHLVRIIKEYSHNVKFCLICNYVEKIIKSLMSICTPFYFRPLSHTIIKNKIKLISKSMNFKVTDDGAEKLIKIANGDLRKIMTIMESTKTVYDTVTEKTISICITYPIQSDIDAIYYSLLHDNIVDAYNNIKLIITNNGYSLSDILKEIFILLINSCITKTCSISSINCCNLISLLRNIERNLTTCQIDDIQFGSFVGSFILYRDN